MTFTSVEDAKPKVSHKEGLPCLGCGELTASLWRGPGGRYCSLADCKKEAQRKRAELDASTCTVPPTTAAAQEL